MSFDGGRGPPNIEGMTSLKVDNLTYRTGIDDLKRVFGKHGDVGDIYIPRDKKHDHSRGFAFIRYWEKRDAEDAMDALDRTKVDGREIRVQMARYGRPTESYKPSRRDSYGGRDSGGRGSSYNSSRYRSRSRSRSPRRSRGRHSRSKSPRRRNSGSRSPKRRRSRSYSPRTSPRRSRSPVKRASHSRSRSRSPPRHRGSKSRSPSRSPVRRSRSRSPVKRSPSRSPREEPLYDGPNGEFTGNVNEEVED